MFTEKDVKAVNEIRCFCADVIQGPKSGHPGAAIGMSPMAYVLFAKVMRFAAAHPQWMARDRFVLSSGHASSLLYTMLHLTGYGYTVEDLKAFRSLHSRTPGHPERVEYETNARNPGIEVTTGPLGQGIANAVGMAIAAKALEHYDPEHVAVDEMQRIYCICGDGCLQEGVASEACSLAGTKKLNNLIVLYDDNHIQIDGRTSLAFGEDVKGRFEAYGWNVLEVADGNTDLQGIYDAIVKAQKSDKPTLIKVTTTIGFGADKQDSSSVHGSPLGPEGVQHLKKHFGLPEDQFYHFSDETKQIFADLQAENEKKYAAWEAKFAKCAYAADLTARFDFVEHLSVESLGKELLPHAEKLAADFGAKATRQSSQAVLQLLNDTCLGKYMIVGSADLAPSNLTTVKGLPETQYVHYGVREFGMAAMSNGIAAYGGFVPFDATFLVFFNYCVGSIRVGALSRLQCVHVFTHDSIYVGEDGSTHQPIETLAQIRAMIGVYDWRPCDAIETLGAYMGAVGKPSRQHILCLTRQAMPLQKSDAEKTATRGAYVIHENPKATHTVIATGSEVDPCVKLAEKLNLRVVSMPSFKLFCEQPKEYQQEVLKFGRDKVIAVECYVGFGLERFAAHTVGIETYGASAAGKEVAKFYGMDLEGIEKRISAI